METKHTYRVRVTWTGNQGTGTANYLGYSRAHEIAAPGKPVLVGSSDPSFRGDATRWNPEELLLALQLRFCFEVCALSGSLVSSAPE